MMQSRADNGGDGRREGVIKLSVSGFLHQADAKSAVNSNKKMSTKQKNA